MEDIMSYFIKLTAGLIGVMIILRLLGPKELAQITPLDFVYALILGSIVEESLYETDTPFYHMLMMLGYWALLIYVIERFAMKNERFRRLTKGSAQMLINDGKIDKKVLDRNNMDVDEVRELLRMKGVFSLREVKHAIMETSGLLSIIRYADEEPPNRSQVMTDYRENSISYLFIDGGEIEYTALKAAGFDEDWLKRNIEEDAGASIKDIFIAEWNETEGFYIQTK
ncbi:DUF421 domain-containing protein [Lacicoccus alkaliphilus]|uniref:Uncharacterized membrane protein YcaP, DUF421 family n=1 Tax=Lacicoccus alkaliphilus DSM 16010 TaxID=1123231 RepID=A0A1M7DUQ0_9BACL|nr:DUF421 domain-containing protein [Salinicoccus alkaliphilus]SHL83222.1 Uncharacterized membrane protein YcaP, DUF421 family [Salinicoccus alkaliphilus DSM 16010]